MRSLRDHMKRLAAKRQKRRIRKLLPPMPDFPQGPSLTTGDAAIGRLTDRQVIERVYHDLRRLRKDLDL